MSEELEDLEQQIKENEILKKIDKRNSEKNLIVYLYKIFTSEINFRNFQNAKHTENCLMFTDESRNIAVKAYYNDVLFHRFYDTIKDAFRNIFEEEN